MVFYDYSEIKRIEQDEIVDEGLFKVIVKNKTILKTECLILKNGGLIPKNWDTVDDAIYGFEGVSDHKIVFENKKGQYPCFAYDLKTHPILCMLPGIKLPSEFEKNIQDIINEMGFNEKEFGFEKDLWNQYLEKKPSGQDPVINLLSYEKIKEHDKENILFEGFLKAMVNQKTALQTKCCVFKNGEILPKSWNIFGEALMNFQRINNSSVIFKNSDGEHPCFPIGNNDGMVCVIPGVKLYSDVEKNIHEKIKKSNLNILDLWNNYLEAKPQDGIKIKP